MLTDFLKGFGYLVQGFRLVSEPSLRRFVWVPILCNMVLFILMFVFAAYGLNIFSQWVQQFLPYWLQWLGWFIWILSILFSGIALVYLSTMVVNIVAGPFNSVLSEKVLGYLKIPDQPISVSALWGLTSSVLRQIRFIIYYLPRAVFFLLLFIIPVVQVLAAFFWFLFNGWVFTMQYLDYPMENHGISITEMRKMMSDKPGLCFGFGSAVVIFAMIPLINFVIVPVAVVGATLLWANEFRIPSKISKEKVY